MNKSSSSSARVPIVAIFIGHYWISTASLIIALSDAASLMPPLILLAGAIISPVPSIFTIFSPNRRAGLAAMFLSAVCTILVSVGIHDLPILSPMTAAGLIFIVQTGSSALGPILLASVRLQGRKRALIVLLPLAWTLVILLFGALSNVYYQNYYLTCDRLEAHLGSRDMQLRWEAADRLGRSNPVRVIYIATSDPDPRLRSGAVLAIGLGAQSGSIQNEDAVVTLISIVKTDSDKWVRLQAVNSLGMFVHNASDMIRAELSQFFDPDAIVNSRVQELLDDLSPR